MYTNPKTTEYISICINKSGGLAYSCKNAYRKFCSTRVCWQLCANGCVCVCLCVHMYQTFTTFSLLFFCKCKDFAQISLAPLFTLLLCSQVLQQNKIRTWILIYHWYLQHGMQFETYVSVRRTNVHAHACDLIRSRWNVKFQFRLRNLHFQLKWTTFEKRKKKTNHFSITHPIPKESLSNH